MPPKRKCIFNSELQAKFPFIHKNASGHDVSCGICAAKFSIANGGASNIKQHMDTIKHKNAVVASSSSHQLTNLFRTINFNDKEKELAITEGTWAYHSVQHNYSFRSNDCTSKLIKSCFEKKYSCARTKCKAIIENIFKPVSLDSIKSDLCETSCIAIYLDCSNHGPIKLCPILIRYFLPNKGIMVKILAVNELKGENSDIISKSLQETLDEFKIKSKMVAFCGDNTNCNFGGAARNGRNNIFHKMKNFVGKDLIGVNCVAHILNNCIQTAADSLPIDIEVIIVKVYSFFYIYTIRVEKLKEICKDVDIEYKKLLGHSKTRWLTLMPALERVLKLFVPLKEYFLSQQKCPMILQTFFNDPCAELCLLFAHSQAFTFHKYICRLESQHISMPEAAIILKDLKLKLIARKEEVFLPLIVKNNLAKLELEGKIDGFKFKELVSSFYDTCIGYLNQWDAAFRSIEHFDWVVLSRIPCWQSIEKSLVQIKELRDDLIINDEELFDEVACVKNYANAEKIEEWRKNETPVDKKWVEMFGYFMEKNIECKNIMKLVEFSLCLPASNASTERIFSISNNFWTSEKSQLKVITLESLLITKCNFQMDCTEFKSFLSNNSDILKKIHSVEKYQ